MAVSRCSDTGKIVALAFNYPKEYESHVPGAEDRGKYMNASSKHVNLTVSNLEPNTLFEVEMLDSDHGDVSAAMQSIDISESTTREEIELLKNISTGTLKKVVSSDAQGNLIFDEELQPWACAMIRQI